MRNSIAIYPRKHPRVLFKYLDVNGASLTLKDESLKFTPPNQLNDMFECLPAGVRRSRRLSRKEAGAYLVLQYESASGRIHYPAPVSDQNTLNAWRAGKITREKLEEVRRIAENNIFWIAMRFRETFQSYLYLPCRMRSLCGGITQKTDLELSLDLIPPIFRRPCPSITKATVWKSTYWKKKNRYSACSRPSSKNGNMRRSGVSLL